MSSRKSQDEKPGRRERRTFTAEFKREAVRLLHERRVTGVSVAQIARDLDVKPEQVREWARRLAEQEGGLAAAGVVETPEQELKRLRRENARLKEEQAFLKKVAVYFTKESR